MFSEDYLLRMINQAVAVLQHLLRLKRAGQYQQALQAADTALETLLGLRASLLRQLDDEKMLSMLTLNEELDLERLSLLAQIFNEENEILTRLARSGEALLAAGRALRFSLELVLNDPTRMNAEHIAAIEKLRRQLRGTPLPLATRLACLDYLEALRAQPRQRLAAAGVNPQNLAAEIQALQAELDEPHPPPI